MNLSPGSGSGGTRGDNERGPTWAWLADKLWLVVGSLLGSWILVLTYMYHLSVKFEAHHVERQLQFAQVAEQLKRVDQGSQQQALVVTDLRLALSTLQGELVALRRDIGRIEQGRGQ